VSTNPALAMGLAVAFALGLGGCATQGEGPETAPPPAARPAVGTATPSFPATPQGERFADRPWDDPNSPLSRKLIYFDYDSSEIRQEFVPLLQTHAGYMAKHPQTRVTLEGHTDERGSREYNLALGDQRAQTVQRFMLAEGVQADQVATLSFGEEKPAAAGHGEGAWSQNRRVELAY